MEPGARQRRALCAAIAACSAVTCASLALRALAFAGAEANHVTDLGWLPLVKELAAFVVIAAILSVAVLMRSLPAGQGTSRRDWRRASPTALLLLVAALIIADLCRLILLADQERALMTGAAGCSLWAFKAWREGTAETTTATVTPPGA